MNTLLLGEMLEILSVSVPVLEIVITVSLNKPILTLAKLTVALLATKIGNGAWPVPDTVMVSGLDGALLTMIILPEYPPAKEGLNRSVSEKDCPGGTTRTIGWATNTMLLGVMLAILSVSDPLLEIVTTVSLNPVMLTIPKLKFELLSARIGVIAPPDPERLRVSGDVNELLVAEILPPTGPPTEGVNLSVSTMVCPGAILPVVGRAVNTAKLPKMFVIRRVSVPVFEIVIVVSLKCPTLLVPKLRLETLNARIGYGVTPVTGIFTGLW